MSNRKVRWRTQDENMHRITAKTNNGPNFQFAKFTIIDLILTDRRNLSGTRPNRPVTKLPASKRFSFLVARNAIAKATEYVTFGFSFRILIFLPL